MEFLALAQVEPLQLPHSPDLENKMDPSVDDNPGTDRVRRLTPPEINREIDRRTTANIHHYSHASQDGIAQRIAVLDREWDVGRMLKVGAASLPLPGWRLE